VKKNDPLERLRSEIDDARAKVSEALEHTAKAQSIALNNKDLEVYHTLRKAYLLLRETLER